MLNRKTFLAAGGLRALALSLAFVLTACGAADGAAAAADDGLAAAVADGFIAAGVTQKTGGAADYPVTEARRGEIKRYSDLAVRLDSGAVRELRFEHDGGRLKEVYVDVYDRVKKGDALAEIYFDRDALEAERRQLSLRAEQFETRCLNEEAAWGNRLDKARAFTQDMDEDGWEVHQLTYRKLALEHERAVYQQGLERLDFAERIAEIDERLAGEVMVAPFDGVVRYVFYGREGNPVPSEEHVITVIHDASLHYVLNAPKDVARYGDVFTLTDRTGDIRFDVQVASDPLSPLQPENTYDFILRPADFDSFYDLAASFDVDPVTFGGYNLSGSPLTLWVQNALILPRRAVIPEDKKNYVYLYEDGTLKKRYVKIGFSYADDVQILEGLEEGQQVVMMS